MKYSAVIILLLIFPCLAQEDSAMVRFANGDQLSGKIQDLSQEVLIWQSDLLKEPAEFELKHVIDLNMPVRNEKIESAAGHDATLELTNGDTVHGQLTVLNDEKIGLATSFAGEVVFQRVNVKSVRISEATDHFYRGPNGLNEWTQAKDDDSWSFRNGALYASGADGIAREIDFPKESSISFDAAWLGSFKPRIIFYSDDITTSQPKSGYEMAFQGNSVHMKKSGHNSWLGHTSNAGQLRENEKARIEIRVSVRTGKILLFVDDEFIEMWEDADLAETKFGNGFHIVSQDSTPLRISNILVKGWDGYTEDLPIQQDRFQGRGFGGDGLMDDDGALESEDEAHGEGRMILKNGDSIEGEVSGIKGDSITLNTTYGEVTFPLARLKNLELKEADLETPKRYKEDVRAHLSDGSRLVFRLDGVEDDVLIGFSQNFGTTRFQRDALQKIEFNIHNRQLDSLRYNDDW